MNNIVVLINFKPVNYSALIIDVEYSDEFEISYFIKSDYRRKDIVYTAIKLLIEVFFDNKVTRMRVNKDPTKHKIENLEVNKLVEKTINVCKFTIFVKKIILQVIYLIKNSVLPIHLLRTEKTHTI